MKKIKEQQRMYELFHNMGPEELKDWYDSYRTAYPSHVSSLIKCLAEVRGFDTSDWKEFYR